jgi:phage terminase large subunit-like protein
MLPVLRPYQFDVITAVMDSVTRQRGLTFSIEIARQGGKNEISARIELILMYLRSHESDNLVKCSPTFMPQAVISMTRLKDRLDNAGFTGIWVSEHDYIIRFGNARAVFLSAEASARVVGHTAHLLLEIDEAQDVGKEKYAKEFRPMGSTTNVTTVLYGTAWDDSTLLEETKQTNLELERKDGIRRHFQYDWQEVAKYNPVYQAYVENKLL